MPIQEETPANSIGGTWGDDTLTGTSGDDTIYGYGGIDTINGGDGNDTINGGSGGDTIHGGYGDDTINVTGGDNTLYGDYGSDTIIAAAGNDTLEGGSGGNTLEGGAGNDNYVFGGGDDLIIEYSGTDQITMPSGITVDDLTFTRVSTEGSTSNFNDLLITVDTGGSIEIQNQFAGSSYRVESILFNDTSTLDLTSLTSYTTVLHERRRFYSPGGTDDITVHGLGGNDYIQTGSGNDTIDGGVGNDDLHGGTGNDTYIASPGFDTITTAGAPTPSRCRRGSRPTTCICSAIPPPRTTLKSRLTVWARSLSVTSFTIRATIPSNRSSSATTARSISRPMLLKPSERAATTTISDITRRSQHDQHHGRRRGQRYLFRLSRP